MTNPEDAVFETFLAAAVNGSLPPSSGPLPFRTLARLAASAFIAVPGAYVKQGRRYVDGVPVGGWVEDGTAYTTDAGTPMDAEDFPLYRLRERKL